ncbi:serine/threonine-protein kinase [Kitasatospora sp. NPDC050543]|uniref:serine/threonine-protein kinase n=1 Tax=Kitasatospora sp. NPDC050543 TaxID=3364054 RepID=UPI0037BAF276
MSVQDRSEAAEVERVLAGRYELGERLGRGGMGTVWRARDRMLDREVAVKELTVRHLSEEDLEILQSRMKREARAAARIKHPGVITIHDVLEQDGRPWIVMELVDGRSLADVISQDGTLLPREAAEVGMQVLAALHRGHQLGVLHRDVKPPNVLLERGTGRVVLLDFGIATFEGSAELTRPGDLVGSPDYLAPERAQGERPGPASDLWGLGATLYAAVEGESPFRRTSPLTTLAAVVADPLPEPRRAGALGPVLAALMAKAPEDRPTADEAMRMLAEVTDGHTIGFRPAPGSAQKEPTQSVPVVDRTEQPAGASAEDAAPTGPTAPAAAPVPAPATAPPAAAPAVAHPAPVAAAETHAVNGRAVPGRPARRGRKVLWLAAIGLATALVAAGAAYFVSRGTHNVPNPQPSASGTPTAGPSGPAAPAGYRWVDDPAGFRFPLPVASPPWLRTVDGNQIFYSPDNNVHYLQFAVAVGQGVQPLDHFEEMETTVGKLKDYRQIKLTGARFKGQEAAVWEFTYAAKEGGRRHAIEEEFIDENGTSYAIYLSCPDRDVDWKEGANRFTTVLNHFTPIH